MRRNQDCPLEGKSLIVILLDLVDEYGWKELSELTRINIFQKSPDFTTSLKYLHKTPSAKKKVQDLYKSMVEEKNPSHSIAVFSTAAMEAVHRLS